MTIPAGIAGAVAQTITHPQIHSAIQIPFFRFYTLWNWIILATYFGLAALESWKLMRLSTGQPPKLGRIGQACVVLFHICITVRLSPDMPSVLSNIAQLKSRLCFSLV